MCLQVTAEAYFAVMADLVRSRTSSGHRHILVIDSMVEVHWQVPNPRLCTRARPSAQK